MAREEGKKGRDSRWKIADGRSKVKWLVPRSLFILRILAVILRNLAMENGTENEFLVLSQ